MTTKTIEITIQPDGEASVQTHGFAGPGCIEASRFIETALGRKTDERLTPEYHRTEVTQRTTHQAD